MGAYGKILRSYERSDLQRLLPQPAYHGRDSAIHYARRLAAPSPRCGFFLSFAAPLETGGALLVFVGRDAVISLDSAFFRVSSGSPLPPPQNSPKW